GHVLDLLAEMAAMQLDSSGPGRADEADGEARVVCHRDDGRLAVARQALDADPFGVHRLVGLEVIQRPAGAPRPRPQRSPVVNLARLALVAQADDTARQARATVGLDAAWHEDGIA